MDDKDAIPISVINQMIEELKAEADDKTHMMIHGVIILELLKGRWERMCHD